MNFSEVGVMEDTLLNAREQYFAWDIFKKDLETNLGHYVPISLWIQMKPKKPLPWSDADLHETVLDIKKTDSGLSHT
jgi:hypothetical protein